MQYKNAQVAAVMEYHLHSQFQIAAQQPPTRRSESQVPLPSLKMYAALIAGLAVLAVAKPITPGVSKNENDIFKRYNTCKDCDDWKNQNPDKLEVACDCQFGDDGNGFTTVLGVKDATFRSSVANSDWTDGTGQLPDGTVYKFTVSHTSSISVTQSVEFNFGGSFEQEGVTASAGVSLGQSITVTESTSETEEVDITIKCNGAEGKIQYKPLFLAIDGEIFTQRSNGNDPEPVSHGQGTVFVPQTGSAGNQLVSYQVVCS